jgi:tight adherence protein B
VHTNGMEENMKKALVSRSNQLKVTKPNDRVMAYLVAALSFLVVSSITSSIYIGIAFSILSGVACKQFLKQRANQRSAHLTQIWPEVIDHLVAGLYSGLSISEALSELANRGPEVIRADFAWFNNELRNGSEFTDAINILRNKFAHHGSDQIFEALLLSKTLGGGELLNTLRTLGSFQREDLILNKEIAIKHGWIRNSAHISAAAPWVLLIMIGTQSGTATAFATPKGLMILIAGIAMTFLAYLWMSKISKLPVAPRVFRG